MLNYGIALICSVAACCLLGNRKYRWICSIFIGLVMAILAFNMDVHASSDLNRYYYYLDFFRDRSILDSLRFAIAKSNPLHFVSMILFSKFSNNQIYTAVITFVDYFLIVKLVGNVCNDYNLSKRCYVFGVTFILLNLNFFLLANVVRIFFVFAVFFYCLYEEAIRRRHKVLCWCIYIALVFYHYAMVILIAARVFSIIISIPRSKKSMVYKMLFGVAVLIGVTVLINSPLGGYIIGKTEDYSNYMVRGYRQTIIGIIQFAMIMMMIFAGTRFNIRKLSGYDLTLIALGIFTLISFSNYQMILRFGNAMVMASGFCYMTLYKDNNSVFDLRRLRFFEVVNILGSTVTFAYTMIYYYRNFL